MYNPMCKKKQHIKARYGLFEVMGTALINPWAGERIVLSLNRLPCEQYTLKNCSAWRIKFVPPRIRCRKKMPAVSRWLYIDATMAVTKLVELATLRQVVCVKISEG